MSQHSAYLTRNGLRITGPLAIRQQVEYIEQMAHERTIADARQKHRATIYRMRKAQHGSAPQPRPVR